ncbi:MAG: hypothetical protein ACFB0D_23020 [Phormidesmis sp.]
MTAYVTFTAEFRRATYLFHEAEVDKSLGLIEPAKNKLRQVQSELEDCNDAGAISLLTKARDLLNSMQ